MPQTMTLKEYRVSGFPMDAYHIVCHSHKTRLKMYSVPPA